MGGLTTIENLVTEARSAGLRLQVDGELLRIKGNRKATAIAKELLNRKAEVIEYLAAQPETAAVEMHAGALLTDEPTESCPICCGAVQEQRGKHFRHVWCPQPGHFDAWRAQGGRKLSNSDAPIVREREGDRRQ